MRRIAYGGGCRRAAIALMVVLAVVTSGCVTPRGPDGSPLLTLADQKDGDSFVASDGVEYRVGMINTPEVGECGATEATAATAAFLMGGFSVEVYAEDTHGRSVARVHTREGDLGVHLAREGFADDRYVDQFQHENPAYATVLKAAFLDARDRGAGIWSTCAAG